MTRRRFGWIGWIFGAVLVVAIGIGAVAGLTATGVLMIGESEEIGQGSVEEPLFVKAGYVRNTAPWSLEIVSITVDGVPLGARAAILDSDAAPAVESSSWVSNLSQDPVTIEAGTALTIWVELAAPAGSAVGFDSLTVDYVGPLGLVFGASNARVGAIAFSPGLPEAAVSFNPRVDDTAVNRYVAVIRDALAVSDANALVTILRADSTADDAVAFQTAQAGIAAETDFSIRSSSDDGLEYEVQFLVADGVEVPPPFLVEWQNYRWSVTSTQP